MKHVIRRTRRKSRPITIPGPEDAARQGTRIRYDENGVDDVNPYPELRNLQEIVDDGDFRTASVIEGLVARHEGIALRRDYPNVTQEDILGHFAKLDKNFAYSHRKSSPRGSSMKARTRRMRR